MLSFFAWLLGRCRYCWKSCAKEAHIYRIAEQKREDNFCTLVCAETHLKDTKPAWAIKSERYSTRKWLRPRAVHILTIAPCADIRGYSDTI